MGATKGRKARETPFRWAVLIMMMIAIYSFVYCYDNPNAMQNELIREYGISQIQYNMLYSIYGYVNMIAPLVAGMMIDSLGIYTSTLGFQIFIVLGQSLFILGAMESSYGLMVFGRAVFGVGAEQYHTSRKWLAYEYFTTAEYMLASGLTLSASRFGSATQSYAVYKTYDDYGIVAALSVGWVLVMFSLILTIAFTIWQKYYYANIDEKQFSESLSNAATQAEKEKMQQAQSLSDVDLDGDSSAYWNKHKAQNWEKFQLKALVQCKFDTRFWMFGMLLIFFYSTYLAYSNVGSAFIQARYQKSHEEGNSLAPIMFWIAAIFTPIQGFICDYYGKRMPFMMLAAFCLLFGHIFVGFIGNADRSDGILVFGLILLGLGYSIGAGSCWPCCGIIVQQRYLATALGFWACIDNGFQACMFVIVGALTKTYSDEEYEKESPNPVRIHEFDDARWLWIVLSICTMVWVLLLWYFDRRDGGNILMKPEDKWAKKRGLATTVATKETREVSGNEEEGAINIETEQENVMEADKEITFT